MIAGTLLGAVRHKGFIPWDDDMDFGMMRTDFDRFVEVAKKEIDAEVFSLQTMEDTQGYPFSFAKLRLKGTTIEEEFSKDSSIDKGIAIDIFPFESVPDDENARRKVFRDYYVVKNLLFIKCGFHAGSNRSRTTRVAAKLASFFFSERALKNRKRQIFSPFERIHTKRVVAADGTYGLERETLERRWVEKLTSYPFEDRVFLGSADYDAYLSHLYGNYMQLPPENKRNHHKRLSIDFGSYQFSDETEDEQTL